MVKIEKSVLEGEINAPSSKSHAIRYLILSGLGSGKSIIKNTEINEDISDAINLLRSSDTKVNLDNKNLVTYPSSSLNFKNLTLESSATVYRIAIAIGASYEGKKIINISESLLKRPVNDLINALNSAGAKVVQEGNKIIISKKVSRNNFFISGKVSSQFITALMFISIAKNEKVEINISDELVSKTYFNITKEIMEKLGSKIIENNNKIIIIPKVPKNISITIPGDFTLSAYFGSITSRNGKEIVIKNLDVSGNGDSKIVDIFNDCGIENKIIGNDWVIKGPSIIKNLDLEMKDFPDLVPPVSSVLSTASGISNIRKIEHLTYKESNRINEIVKILNYAGIIAYYKDGTLTINGGKLKKFIYNCPSDHRMAMLSISLQAISGGETTNDECLKKSYPNFLRDFKLLGGVIYGD
ncbi:MAG: 3-phosphoshikimate 1-carboxyvinyltransferase [Thermoplasmata archaeon]